MLLVMSVKSSLAVFLCIAAGIFLGQIEVSAIIALGIYIAGTVSEILKTERKEESNDKSYL